MTKRLLQIWNNTDFVIWRQEWGWLAIVGLLALVASILWFSWVHVEKKTHVGYFRARVLWTQTLTTEDSGFDFAAAVELPSGEAVRVTTRQLFLAQQVVETACLEQRRGVETDRPYYRLADRANCPED